MPIAFMLMNTEIACRHALKKIPVVEEAYMVYGVYDILVKVKANTMDELKEIVSSHVRQLEEIQSTLTMIVVESK